MPHTLIKILRAEGTTPMSEQNTTPDVDDTEGHGYKKDDEIDDTEGHGYKKDDEDEDDTEGHGYKH